jgi:hypothetical protein
MEFPVGIGTPTTKILFAGPQDTFARCAATISPLGGGLKYIGPNIGAAAALDLALLSKHVGMVLGVIHGALVCRSENVGIDSFAVAAIFALHRSERGYNVPPEDVYKQAARSGRLVASPDWALLMSALGH